MFESSLCYVFKISTANFAVAFEKDSTGVEAKSEGGIVRYVQRPQRDDTGTHGRRSLSCS